MKKNKAGQAKLLAIFFFFIVIAAIAFYFIKIPPVKYWFGNPSNFEECKEATGGFILKTKPAKCLWDGVFFTEGEDAEASSGNE